MGMGEVMERLRPRRKVRPIAMAAIAALLLALTACSIPGGPSGPPSGQVTQAASPPPTDEFPNIPGFDWSRLGYGWSESYVAGDARSYNAVTPLSADGAWNLAADPTTAPFKTRIRVLKPSDPRRFNGTVYVEWLNVSAQEDAAASLGYGKNELMREGAIHVGVSAQAVGVSHLLSVYSSRYGPAGANLVHPGDSYSYDIFQQVGNVLRTDANAIFGSTYRVKRLIAGGESQSAGRLVTYVNALAQQGAYDGYLIHSRGANGAALRQSPLTPIPTPGPTLIRTDLTQPVLTFQSEFDSRLPRQADTAKFRWWEVAGTTHIDAYSASVGSTDYGDLAGAQALFDRMVTPFSGPFPPFGSCTFGINAGAHHWVFQAAMSRLNTWLTFGAPPPIAPRLNTSDGTGAGALVLDANGNATGGIRTPNVDVPIAKLEPGGNTAAAPGINFCQVFGKTTPFTAEKLAQLYPNHPVFAAKWAKATFESLVAGFILPADAVLVAGSGVTSNIGN
jgi:hypothetical protein